jgi:1-acyl-sn-glycerol-3-phosphate acyltransferase
MNQVFLMIRATLFWIGFALSTAIAGLISPFLLFLSQETSYKILVPWTRFNVWWLKVTCGVRYHILGKENINLARNGIILANHQSTWETLLIPAIFPPISWVLKKELFKIPFFGWALSRVKPIAIDRAAGSSAVEQVKVNGKQRLDEGNWVCIFPEGTRVKPGHTERYRMGGALLAHYCATQSTAGVGYPIYPLAHNAGELWPRHSYIKYPGTITVSIGEQFSVEGLEPAEINDKVKTWIEAEVKKMPVARRS